MLNLKPIERSILGSVVRVLEEGWPGARIGSVGRPGLLSVAGLTPLCGNQMRFD